MVTATMHDELIGVELATLLEPYRVTSHGANYWTVPALANVVKRMAWIDQAVSICRGTISSCYRSPVVNRAVKGSVNSRHLLGLAVDIVPGLGRTPQLSTEDVYRMAAAGRLGPVAEIIWEPSWVHVGWQRPGESGGIKLLQCTAPGNYLPLKL